MRWTNFGDYQIGAITTPFDRIYVVRRKSDKRYVLDADGTARDFPSRIEAAKWCAKQTPKPRC